MKKLLFSYLIIGSLVVTSIANATDVCSFMLGAFAQFKTDYAPVYVELTTNGQVADAVTLYGDTEKAQRIFYVNKCITEGTIKFSSLNVAQNSAAFNFYVTYDSNKIPTIHSQLTQCTYQKCCTSYSTSQPNRFNFNIGDDKCACSPSPIVDNNN